MYLLGMHSNPLQTGKVEEARGEVTMEVPGIRSTERDDGVRSDLLRYSSTISTKDHKTFHHCHVIVAVVHRSVICRQVISPGSLTQVAHVSIVTVYISSNRVRHLRKRFG